jgi:hypothetical protein
VSGDNRPQGRDVHFGSRRTGQDGILTRFRNDTTAVKISYEPTEDAIEGIWSICRDFHGSDGTRTATSGVTGRRSCGLLVSPMVSVVVLENELQSVGEGVGGTDPWAREAASQAKFRPRERRDRTQEVAGSSPASSMKTAGNRSVFILERAPGAVQALDAQMHSDARSDVISTPLRRPVAELLQPADAFARTKESRFPLLGWAAPAFGRQRVRVDRRYT